jgi:hypothetical protein
MCSIQSISSATPPLSFPVPLVNAPFPAFGCVSNRDHDSTRSAPTSSTRATVDENSIPERSYALRSHWQQRYQHRATHGNLLTAFVHPRRHSGAFVAHATICAGIPFELRRLATQNTHAHVRAFTAAMPSARGNCEPLDGAPSISATYTNPRGDVRRYLFDFGDNLLGRRQPVTWTRLRAIHTCADLRVVQAFPQDRFRLHTTLVDPAATCTGIAFSTSATSAHG